MHELYVTYTNYDEIEVYCPDCSYKVIEPTTVISATEVAELQAKHREKTS